MKLKTLFLLSTSFVILTGCGNEEEKTDDEKSGESMGTLNPESVEESENDNSNNDDTGKKEETENDSTHDSGLLDLNNTETGWINFEGNLGRNSEYITSSTIEYNPNQHFVLTKVGNIVYFICV